MIDPATLPDGAFPVAQAREPGFYWWLPSGAESTDEQEWVITSWHPLLPTRVRSGWFVGPLVPPVAKPAIRQFCMV